MTDAETFGKLETLLLDGKIKSLLIERVGDVSRIVAEAWEQAPVVSNTLRLMPQGFSAPYAVEHDAWRTRCYGHARGRKKAKRRAKVLKQKLEAALKDAAAREKATKAAWQQRLERLGVYEKPGFYARYVEGQGWYICGPMDDGATAFLGGQDG